MSWFIAGLASVSAILPYHPVGDDDSPLPESKNNGVSGGVAVSTEPTVWIDFESEWKFYDQPTAPPANWSQIDFDDRGWGKGSGLLGYDTADRAGRWPRPGLQTQLTPNLISYAFRTEFDYEGPTEQVRLLVDTIIDDAAIIYLNGVEIGRSEGLPTGDVAWGTSAAVNLGTPPLTENAFELTDAPLQKGKNVLAIALFNRNARSSDICLGIRLKTEPIPYQPSALYLTWQQDPTSTMTIQWHGPAGDTGDQLVYRPRQPELIPGSTTVEPSTPSEIKTGTMFATERTVYTVELRDLQPDTEYEFQIHSKAGGGATRWYWFRTMPASCDPANHSGRPVRIVFGGDVRHRRAWMKAANEQAVRFEPDAIVWGGDLAYANGQASNIHLWDEFFDVCNETLTTSQGRVVPIIVCLGNHEIQGGYYWGNNRERSGYQDSDEFRNQIAPYFFSMFAFPGHPGYGVLDFGDYMSILILDTDHAGPVEGTQTDWLAQTIAARKHVTHLFPVYHVPAYPSVRSFQGQTSERVRTHWNPLFDQSQVRVCFEHHDHAYKRTVPILAGKPNPEGIVYVGDGAWGVGLRQQHSVADTWYLDQADMLHHVIVATIAREHLDLKVIASDGRLFDHLILPPRSPKVENQVGQGEER